MFDRTRWARSRTSDMPRAIRRSCGRSALRGVWLLCLLLCLLMWLAPNVALGEIERRGDWPDVEPKVSLDLAGVPRADALRALADEAGWSMVFRDTTDDQVHLMVKDQPASKVLAMLLDDGRYSADRDGTLISIRRLPAAAASTTAPPTPPSATAPQLPASTTAPLPPASATAPQLPTSTTAPQPPAVPAVPAVPSPPKRVKASRKTAHDFRHEHGDDLSIMGEDVTIADDEEVHDLTVLGGSVELLGLVTGDLSVMGGSVEVGPEAEIEGDVSVIGGSLQLHKGALIEGDVQVHGGSLERADGVEIQGQVITDTHDTTTTGDSVTTSIQQAGAAITSMAMLFLFGTILMALANRRMETLQLELASKPMRSFALGIVGSLVLLLLFVLMCITVVGIPLAVVCLLAAVFAGYSGICAVLATVGGTLMRHKTDNVYIHLAAGCALWLVLGSLPYIGGWITFAVVSAGLGSVYATRGAGLLPEKWNRPQGPYRTASAS